MLDYGVSEASLVHLGIATSPSRSEFAASLARPRSAATLALSVSQSRAL